MIYAQIWGALFYLLNKIFFSLLERESSTLKKRRFRIFCWIAYLVALPAWLVAFISQGNWIAASVEFGAAPVMIVGLIIALKGHGSEPHWLNHIAKIFVIIGIAISIYDSRGFSSLNQFLELGITAGFLLGTYIAAKQKKSGYLWFVVGNLCCATLMYRENYYILMAQQLLSLVFVIDAYCSSSKKSIKSTK